MKDTRICVIGLGYVGLPLARLFSTKYPTVGFDMNPRRVEALMAGHDSTLEVADDLTHELVVLHGCAAVLDDDGLAVVAMDPRHGLGENLGLVERLVALYGITLAHVSILSGGGAGTCWGWGSLPSRSS